LSITIGCPSASESGGATMRATMSFALPAPNGTMSRIGFDGYCACAGATAASASAINPLEIMGFIFVLLGKGGQYDTAGDD
jgi:hypothetical protein